MGSINKIFRPIANLPIPSNVVVGGLALIGITLLVVKILQRCSGNENPPPQHLNVTAVANKKTSKGVEPAIVQVEASLTLDVRSLIALMLSPKDMIALALTNKHWEAGVNHACRQKIKTVLGENFIGDMKPLTAFTKIWAPLKPHTHKLAELTGYRISYSTVSEEMRAILRAAKRGTVVELEKAIKALKNRSELTQLTFDTDEYPNPLVLAIQSGNIDKVRLLIDADTPISVGENGASEHHNNTPLEQAATDGHVAILQLLLENGASFSIVRRHFREFGAIRPRTPPLLYLILRKIAKSENLNKKHLRCVVLAMKSWRYEKGLKAIQQDQELAKLAGEFCSKPVLIKFASLLMSYGVKPIFDPCKLSKIIKRSVIEGATDKLEFLSKQGLLNFQEYELDNKSLADWAIEHGQFKLEDYLKERGVFPKNLERALEVLTWRVDTAIITWDLLDNNFFIGKFKSSYQRSCDWETLMKIVDHYKVRVERENPSLTALTIACEFLIYKRFWGWENDFTFLLKVIEDLVKRQANLDASCGGGTPPRKLLEMALQQYQSQPKITARIKAVLGKTAI